MFKYRKFVIDNYDKYRRDEITNKEFIKCVACKYSTKSLSDL